MTPYREILRLNGQGLSQRIIADTQHCARNTVASTISLALKHGLLLPLPTDLTDEKIGELFYPKREAPLSNRKMPDYEYIHSELARNGVTLSLLWTEYCADCKTSGEIPFMYTQFCYHYRGFVERKKATMHIDRKPGDIMEVDWAGDTATITDSTTGTEYPAYIFVAALPYSQYAYVEAFTTQDEEAWISAHVSSYKHFGGVTRILVCDNLKTGVDKNTNTETAINHAYQEMSEYYGTAIIPARVRKPRDKGSVESTVGNASTWIIAALRKQKFFTLHELNSAIKVKLVEFNEKPFQKRQDNRLNAFLDDEKGFLMPLPQVPYELASWKTATVMYNSHIAVDKQNYSVPYEYIKHKVDVRLTKSTIEVFVSGNRICSHPRLHGRPNQYSTTSEHMPENQQKYIEWTPERFVSWAERIGKNTTVVVKHLLSNHKVPQQSFKTCMALLKLGDKYSVTRLEAACEKALSYTMTPSFKNIQTILANGQDRLPKEEIKESSAPSEELGFIRGSEYYDRGGK